MTCVTTCPGDMAQVTGDRTEAKLNSYSRPLRPVIYRYAVSDLITFCRHSPGYDRENDTHVPKRAKSKSEMTPFRLLLWTALIVFIVAFAGVTQPLDQSLRTGRNRFHVHPASGDIVLVPIDDRALHEVGGFPWPRRVHAQLIDELTAAGAKQIFFDVAFETKSRPTDDRMLADAIKRSGKVTLAVRGLWGPNPLTQQMPEPQPMFARTARLASIGVVYNFQNAVWQLEYGTTLRGQRLPSFAAAIVGAPVAQGEFTPDYSIDPGTIPTLDVANVLAGRINPRAVAGKTVVIGTNSELLGDQYYIPGVGKMGGVYVQVLGAETLKSGTPVDLGWLPAFLIACAVTAASTLQKRSIARNGLCAAAVVSLFVAPGFLDTRLIFVDVVPGLLVTTIVWGILAGRALRKRGLVNAVSNLPNLNALRTNRHGRDQALIAARILNYEEAAAALPSDEEQQFVEQIVARLRVGAKERVIYQGDDGIFAWFEDARAPFGNHLEALHSVFRNPARVNGQPLDLSIAFGVEVGSSRSLSNRLASALVAAEEAARDGLKWKYHDPDTLHDASWKLSMLSQLDAAIDKGEVWVAYQPKLDLKTRRIIGAEALARWTHPDKGPIAASEFVSAAEQSDRIAKLTDFVLEKAVAAASAINKRGTHFEVAVNLSARLLTDKGFVLRVSALLARNGLAPGRLTLELTETAALSGAGEGLDMIAKLRELGVNISIDDYGTGLSTLDYLKKVPANEIKIDQSFVKGMVENRSDRVMVQSTIGLAHSLGRQVVAEGVEHRETLELLTEMECDIAQGYVVGRPMSLESLAKRIGASRKRGVA